MHSGPHSAASSVPRPLVSYVCKKQSSLPSRLPWAHPSKTSTSSPRRTPAVRSSWPGKALASRYRTLPLAVGTYHVTALVTPSDTPTGFGVKFLAKLQNVCALLSLGHGLLGANSTCSRPQTRTTTGSTHVPCIIFVASFRIWSCETDLYLHGRQFTWSNEQRCPTLVQIYMVLERSRKSRELIWVDDSRYSTSD